MCIFSIIRHKYTAADFRMSTHALWQEPLEFIIKTKYKRKPVPIREGKKKPVPIREGKRKPVPIRENLFL